MTHLAYSHSPNVSILGAMVHWIRHVLPVPTETPKLAERRGAWRSRVLICIGWLVAVVVQCGLLWLLREVISVAHGLMELWLQLANQQLDLVSLYNAVRPGK